MAPIPSWCRKGAQVVCIAHPDEGDVQICDDPIVGEIYTISNIGWAYGVEGGSPIICVAEINSFDPDVGLAGWDIKYFRPLHTVDTDAELFKHLLTPIHDLSDETLAGELALDAANGRHT